jgi:hypothetical protein
MPPPRLTSLLTACVLLSSGLLLPGCDEARDGAASAMAPPSGPAPEASAIPPEPETARGPRIADLIAEPRAAREQPSAKVVEEVAPLSAKERAAQQKRAAVARKSTDLRTFMPAKCDAGRLFIDLDQLLPADEGSLDALATARLARGASPEQIKKAVEQLKAAGIRPGKAVEAIALCATEEPSLSIAALQLDVGKAKDPATIVADTVKTLTGNELERDELDGLPLLWSRRANTGYFLFVNKNVVLLGDSRSALEEASRGGRGEAAFAGAKGKVVWGDLAYPKPLSIDTTVSGTSFAVRLRATIGAVKASIVQDQLAKHPEKIDEIGKKYPPLEPLVPIIKAARYEPVGDELRISAILPKKTLPEVLERAGKLSPADLEALLEKSAQSP